VPLWTGAGRHGRGLHDHAGVAGLQRVLEDVRVAYFDGDADLSSPERTRSGVLDATGVAHFLGIADTPLARIGRQVPMLTEHQLTLLGYDPSDPDSYDEAALVARPGLVHASDAELRADPVAMAQRAVTPSRATARVSLSISMWTQSIHVTSRWRTSRTTAPECLWRQPGWCYRHCSQPPVWLRSC
jgi:hypothetical protein